MCRANQDIVPLDCYSVEEEQKSFLNGGREEAREGGTEGGRDEWTDGRKEDGRTD